MRIRYFGFFEEDGSGFDRKHSLSGLSKMHYISHCIVNMGWKVKIISLSWMQAKSKSAICLPIFRTYENDIDLLYFPSIRSSNRLLEKINRVLARVMLFVYLLAKVKGEEKIIVYHSQTFSTPLWLARKIKKFHLILEVEEIYGLVWENLHKGLKSELRLFGVCDSFICVSDELRRKLIPYGKDVTTLYGAYETIEDTASNVELFHPKKLTKLIYAGSIDRLRSAALLAVEALEFLDETYCLSIIGAGDQKSLALLRIRISQINQYKGRVACEYLGELRGKEYSKFLRSKDIGLNSQIVGEYMTTAFPSKIISYLVHGLEVVSSPLSSVVTSKVGAHIEFADSDAPKDLAEAIRKVSATRKNAGGAIMTLDIEFRENLRALLLK